MQSSILRFNYLAGVSRLRAVVVGAGLGGCAAAIALRNLGVEVTVVEAATAPRREGEVIGLLPNGTAALAALAVNDIPGRRVEIAKMLHQSGRRVATIDVRKVELHHGFPYVLISRAELLELLESRLDGCISYGKPCVSVASTGSGAEVCFTDGTVLSTDVVVAADGASSAIRASLWPGDIRTFFSVARQGSAAMPTDYPSPHTEFLMLGSGAFAGCFPTSGDRVSWFIEERAETLGAPLDLEADELLTRFNSWRYPLAALLASTQSPVRTDRIHLRRPPGTGGKGGSFWSATLPTACHLR